jgi:hypothetical protein
MQSDGEIKSEKSAEGENQIPKQLFGLKTE